MKKKENEDRRERFHLPSTLTIAIITAIGSIFCSTLCIVLNLTVFR